MILIPNSLKSKTDCYKFRLYANILKFQFGLSKIISKLNEDATLSTENGFWFDYACKYVGEAVVM